MDKPLRHVALPSDSLESMIRSAGNYVHPTDDLRPRTIEAAGERGARQRGRRVAVWLALALLTLPPCGALICQACFSSQHAIVSAADLQDRAGDLATRRKGGLGWALLDAFCMLRLEQASHFDADSSGDSPSSR